MTIMKPGTLLTAALLVATLLVPLPVAGAEDPGDMPPMPTGLSKDTRFIIYYIDKRFEQVDKRFEMLQREMDKRFEILQREMDKRFEQIDKRFEQVDKRFEQVDKRFEQVDKRFEQVNNRFNDLIQFLWMLTGIFTTLVLTVLGYAWWDRRTIIREARNQAVAQIEKEGRLKDLILALREKAKKDRELATILRSFNLL